MTTRLDEIKARLDLAPNYKWTKVENNWSTTTIYSGDDTICTLQIDEDLDEDDEGIEEFMADQAAAAELIAHCPDDLRWLIAELERERVKVQELHESFAYFLEEKSMWGRVGEGDNNCWCGNKSCFKDGKATRGICRFGNDQLESYYSYKRDVIKT